jgi:hypothetical protein
MWSVPSRRSEPSMAMRMLAGVLSTWGPAGVGHEPELGGQYDLVAAVLEGVADEFLVGAGAVDLGGVDQRGAQVDSPVDGADGFGGVAAGAGVGGGHPHRA